MAEFQRMFYIEWTHRLLAMLVGLVALGCMTVALKRRDLRGVIGPHLVAIVLLVIIQAVLGGILVHSGTKTHFLFLHLGMATAILAILAWSILRMLAVDPRPVAPELRAQRRPLIWAVRVTLVLAFVQILLGAMVAGSRGGAQGGFHGDWPLIQGQLIPGLWHEGRSLWHNLLENPTLHQWVHRWFAWLVVLGIGAMHMLRRRSAIGERGRLGIKMASSLIVVQVALGIANIFITHGGEPHVWLALSHLGMALLFIVSLVLVDFDLHHEPAPATASKRQQSRESSAGEAVTA